MTQGELANAITVSVHPSQLEPGPISQGAVTNRKGILQWPTSALTRLEMPASASGYGVRWIDYGNAAEAMDARERARALALAAPNFDDAFAALDAFYKSE